MQKLSVKKVFVGLAICLAAAGFTACSNGLSFKETTDVSVAIPAQVFEEVAARSAWCEKDLDTIARMKRIRRGIFSVGF